VVCYNEQKEEAQKVADSLNDDLAGQKGKAITAQVNLAEETSINHLVADTMDRLGRVDLVINDAAWTKWIPWPQLEDLELADWNKIMTINLTGPFLLIKTVAPIMKKQGAGRVVNISSVAGFHPRGSSIAYAVSKAGLVHLTRCMAVALAPEILVNGVAPGFIPGTKASARLSEAHRQKAVADAALKRPTDSDDIAEIVVEFCRTDSITGQNLVVDAGRVFR
jgi:3-oxoacyl-[acyl-carrier protein] reductase